MVAALWDVYAFLCVCVLSGCVGAFHVYALLKRETKERERERATDLCECDRDRLQASEGHLAELG